MLNELDKNGLSVNILQELSYESKMGKSLVNSLRKFEKETLFEEVSEMRLEKVFNDILGFRMLVDSYDTLLEGKIPQEMRVVDMSNGKANDDGYRGVHLYYQPIKGTGV